MATVVVALACALVGVACRSTSAPAERSGASSSEAETPPAPRTAFDALEAKVVGEGEGPVVILLHGHGTAADDLLPLARALAVEEGMRFVFPAGPVEVGVGGRAWWALPPRHVREQALASGGRDLSREEPRGMVEARPLVTALLREARERFDVEASEIAIGGFSQGAMMAMDAALHADEPPRAVLSFSGALVAERSARPRMARLAHSWVFVSHGRADPLLPFGGSERLVGALRDAGVDVTFVDFAGGHDLPADVVERAREHLRTAFAPSDDRLAPDRGERTGEADVPSGRLVR